MTQSPKLTVLAGGHDDSSSHDAGDHLLLARVQAGEAGAERAFWERFAPLVYGVMARVLGPGAASDDLVQDVFMRLFQRLDTLRDPTALRAFVYSFAVRVLRSELRKRKVRKIMRPWTEVRDEPAASSGVEARQSVRAFYKIMDGLGARQRSAYILRNFDGLSLGETAQALNVSLATVKRILARTQAEVGNKMKNDPLLGDYFSGGRMSEAQRDE